VAKICNGFRSSDWSDHQAMLAGYLVALEGYPEWAIVSAGRKFMRGEVKGQSLAFSPLPAQLAVAVVAELGPVYREMADRVARDRAARERRREANCAASPEERERMKLKFHVLRLAQRRGAHAVEKLRRANREGFEAVRALGEEWEREGFETVGEAVLS
jgi:hypothetical protein